MMTNPQISQRIKGFTLIEMMVTVTVLMILIAIAVPSLTSFIARNRLSTVTNEMVSSLFFLRSEALKRRVNVRLCVKKSTGVEDSCDESTTSLGYEQGWLIYVDCNNNGKYDADVVTCDMDANGVDETPELLKMHETLAKDITLSASSDFAKQISYGMSGRADGAGEFCVSVNSGSANKITVSSNGVVRTRSVSACE